MDILERIIIDGSILAILVAVLGYFLKTSLTKVLDYKIDQKMEERKMNIALQKEMEMSKLRNTIALYPSILEVTYKLRNNIRDIVEHCNSNDFKTDTFMRKGWSKEQRKRIAEMMENLHQMEELVITSKAFADNETHFNFHEFKKFTIHIVNMVSCHIDRKSNLSEDEMKEFLEKLNTRREISEEHFLKITRNVKSKLRTN